MRLLIVSPFFPPLHSIASLRTHAFACHWRDAGHHVTVLTTAKPPHQQAQPLPCPGIEVIEIPWSLPLWLRAARGWHIARSQPHPSPQPNPNTTPAPPPPPGLLHRLRQRTGVFGGLRMPDLTDRWVQPALRWALTQPRWDAVLSSAGPYTAHLVALALRTRGQVGRWIADYRDLWSDHPSVTGLFPFTLREAALERRCLAHVDALTTVSQGLQQRLAQRTRAPVHIVYNGYEPDVPVEAPPEPPAPPGPKLIELVYTGTLYPTGQDPEPLLRACASLRDKSPELASRLRITVAGLSTALWVRTAGALGMPELIHPLGTLPWAQSLGLQRRATALVLLDWHDPAAGVLTGKVFEYLAAEAPVLCIGGGPGSPAAALLQETSRGVILGQDIPSITQALLSLLRGEDLGLRRRDDLISEYTRKSQSLKCLGILTSQTDPPQPPAA